LSQRGYYYRAFSFYSLAKLNNQVHDLTRIDLLVQTGGVSGRIRLKFEKMFKSDNIKITMVNNKSLKKNKLYTGIILMGILFSMSGGTSFGQSQSQGIVVLGDSLTQWGDWNSLFPVSNIINCGNAGDTTEDVLNRVGKAIDSNPKKLFLMIGINDFIQGKSRTAALRNYESILNIIIGHSPAIKVYVQSLLPVNTGMLAPPFSNEDISNFNNKLKNMAGQKNVEYIDLYTAFLKDGQLARECTADGLHLSAEGYNRWRGLIEGFVTEK